MPETSCQSCGRTLGEREGQLWHSKRAGVRVTGPAVIEQACPKCGALNVVNLVAVDLQATAAAH